ncbi:MAG TPA: porin family protein [Allosphingosinicella sp.]
MKKILIVSVAALAFASPAFAADFSGPRVSVSAGLADDDVIGDDAFAYGAEVGYDWNMKGVVLGVSAEIGDTDQTGRELGATARIGGVVGKKVLVYGLGGYSNLNAVGFNFEGFQVGAGVELALGKQAFVKAEHRYANYDSGLAFHQNLLGVGLRF